MLVLYEVTSPVPGSPSGSVTVTDGVSSCGGSAPLGNCLLALSTLGPRTLTATYSGDSTYAGSTSAGEPHQVDLAPTTTAEWFKIRPNSATRPAYSVLDMSDFERTTGRVMRPWRDALRDFHTAVDQSGF